MFTKHEILAANDDIQQQGKGWEDQNSLFQSNSAWNGEDNSPIDISYAETHVWKLQGHLSRDPPPLS